MNFSAVIRFTSSHSGTWNVGDGRVDSIDFVPSKDIAIRGISLHRSSSGTVGYTGQIRLKEESSNTVIASQRFDFTTDDSKTYFDQSFTTPGNVKAGLKYTIYLLRRWWTSLCFSQLWCSLCHLPVF